MRKLLKQCMVDNRGSFTVESAVIISFLVLVITALLFLSFFLYDQCSLERAAAISALRGSEAVWESQDIRYREADKGIREVLENNLLGENDVETHIEVKGNDIEVTLKMQYKWWEFQAKAGKKVINPVAFIRNCRKLEGVIQK